ncbi:uncharacterized protein LOC117293833 [Asterias rubens]|uniref:uncharacterized protein LOC117293833 n=1 Tax=Asterias rubens TaxID=7604 RepID=UPI0014550A99|nr:uncharacterized protein LOC117293833 [Asterias rubens]
MNDIVSKAQSFLETLQKASGKDVDQWDIEALQRAVEWAKYFEQVHQRLLNRPHKIQQLNRGLYLIGHLPGAALSQLEVTFEALGQSVRLLFQILLQNPYLSSSLHKEVIRQYSLLGQGVTSAVDASTPQNETGSPENPESNIFITDITRFAKEKATRLCLLQMREKLNKALANELNIEGKDVHQVDLETNALLLRNHLMHHMTDSQSKQKTMEYLNKHLQYVASRTKGLEIIGSILGLPGAESEAESAALKRCEEYVFNWMMENRVKSSVDDNMENG